MYFHIYSYDGTLVYDFCVKRVISVSPLVSVRFIWMVFKSLILHLEFLLQRTYPVADAAGHTMRVTDFEFV